MPRRLITPVGRRGGKAVVYWPGFFLLQAAVLAVQSIGVAAVALYAPDSVRGLLIALMSAVIAFNALLIVKRTSELLADDPEDLPDLDRPRSAE